MNGFRTSLMPCLIAATLLAVLAGPVFAGLIGSNFYISESGSRFPKAAYGSQNTKYLVVWTSYSVVYGRLVTNGGAVSGPIFRVSDAPWGALYPNVAYNATNNEFLVTWDTWERTGNDCIYGQRVNAADGYLVGGNFAIGTVYGGGRSSVAWSSTSNCYLVVYYAGYPTPPEIYGQRVSGSGSLLGSNFNISNDSADYSGYPSVGYGSSGNQFLVTWDCSPGGTNLGYIDGQRVDAGTGSFIGSKIAIARGGAEARSQVTYDTTNNRWLVQFNESKNAGYSFDQYGQLISTDGSLYGSEIPIAHTIAFEGETLLGCDVAFVPGVARFFGVFQLDSNMGGQEVYASGTLQGGQVTLGTNTGGAMSNAADTSLNRVVTVWESLEGSVHYIRGQLYELPVNVPPGPVSNFVATPQVGQVYLTWTNPSETCFTGTMIRYKTTGYPTSPTDGTLVVDKLNTPGSNDSYTHTGLTNEVTYYYTAYAHNSTPEYGAGRSTLATPSTAPGLMIIPKPQEWTWKTALTGFLVNGSTQIMANSSPDSKETNAAQQLQRKIWDMTGYWPTIVYGGSTTTNVIAIGDPSRCPAVSSIISTWSDASGKTFKSEGYMIGVKDTSIVIRGWDNAGTFYGCQTLIQLLEYYKTNRIAALFSYDYPELPWRGMYFRIKWEHEWAFTKELISEVVARYKMNRVMVDASLLYSSHPEIPTADPDYPRDSNMADMYNFTRLHYITEIGCFGPWANSAPSVTYGTQHSDLREDTSEPQDDLGESLCPRNPNARALVNEVWDEMRSDFGHSYMHCGQSEYYHLGWDSCPYCGPYANDWLYSDFLTKDRNDLYTDHGVTTIIWGDMLNPNQNGGASKFNTANAVDTMPSDTIIFDWLYDVYTDYTSLDIWTAHGRKACGTPFGFGVHPEYGQYYGDKENIYYWAKSVNDRRASYPNLMLGIVAFNKYTANSKRPTLDTPLQMDQLEEWPFVAEWSWNPEGRNWQPVYPFDGKAMVKRELSPDRVTNFAASPSGSNVNLSWTNPTDTTFTGVRIMYKTSGYPSGPNDGTLLVDKSGTPGANDSYTHTSAPSTVYYAAYSHDNVKHYSPAANVCRTNFCSQEYFIYPNGALNGQGGWSGDATSSDVEVISECVRIWGGTTTRTATKTVSCGDNGTGYIWVRCKINGELGTNTLWSLYYNDSAGKNFARWYGSGTTARGRIGATSSVTPTKTLTGGWDTIDVKITLSAKTSEFFFNGTSIGTLSYSSQGTGSAIGQLKFERTGNSGTSGNHLYFDDLTISSGNPDTTPPGPVTNFAATSGDNQIALAWTNPGDADYAGTRIMFKTTGYPTGPTDGTLVYDAGGTSTIHTGLTNGVTYYYAAYAHDEAPNYSAVANASAVPVDTPPANVTEFTATGGDVMVSLSWVNPPADFYGVKIMFKTTGYPTGPSDGTQCYNGTGTSTVHAGLTNNVTYYYKAFAYDEVPLYASGASASATPADVTAPGNVSSFMASSGNAKNTLGWTNPGDPDFAGVKIMFKTTGYPSGPTDGTQCYSGAGTSYEHTGLTNGVTYYYKAFAYDEVPNYASGTQASAMPGDVTPPGPVTSLVATSGDTQNGLSWTKPGDADLAGVKIMFKTTGYPTSPTDGTQVYNGLGTSTTHTGLTNGVTCYYSAWAYDGVPNYSTKADANATPADTVAPGQISNFTASPVQFQINLSWTNPGDADFAGVKIQHKSTGYPTGPTDGTTLYSGAGTSCAHTGVTYGVTYYYSAFTYDEVPNYSAARQTTGALDQGPYSGVISLPGTVQAENYDLGGQGIAYSDYEPSNLLGYYRSDGVDIEPTSDTGGGYNVGHIVNGEWLEYTVNVTSAGYYTIRARVAGYCNPGKYRITVGARTTGERWFYSTGGFQNWISSDSYIYLDAGQQILKFEALSGVSGHFYESDAVWNLNKIEVLSGQPQAPFSNVISLPATIQAENFDVGGEDVSYNDYDAGNNGGVYRIHDNVDIEATSDTGGGYDVGWLDTGDWMEYTVNVPSTGFYDINVRVAAPNSGTFHIEQDGVDVTAQRTFPATGGWQTWQTVKVSSVYLTAGQRVLKLRVDVAPFNLNWIEVVTPTSTPYVWPASLPGTIQAEDFNNGGQTLSYYDTDAGNNGGVYRSTDVDIEGCSEGGYNVGWISAGEWMEWSVCFDGTGYRNVGMRVASAASGGTFSIYIDGVDVSGPHSFGGTGGWQTWATYYTGNIWFNAGRQKLRVYVHSGGWNLNSIQVL